HPHLPPLFPYTTLFRSIGRPVMRLSTQSTPICRSPVRTATMACSRTPSDGSPGAGAKVAWKSGVKRNPDGPLRTSRSAPDAAPRSEEHTSELQSLAYLV